MSSRRRFSREFKVEAVKLVKERVRKRVYRIRLARADIFDYIEVSYDRNRRHTHLGGVSPDAFERASA